jgi:hypothetical protein
MKKLITTIALTAGLLFGGAALAPVAHAAPTCVDSDGDGHLDREWVDANGDGELDAPEWVDEDADGVLDNPCIVPADNSGGTGEPEAAAPAPAAVVEADPGQRADERRAAKKKKARARAKRRALR